jgi:hypothetical protein
MIKSFVHSEIVTARLTENIVKISIFERPRTEEHLFYHSKFYKEVEIMNRKLSDFIVKTCEMEG